MKIQYLVTIDLDGDEYDAGESVVKPTNIVHWIIRGMEREGFSTRPVVCERNYGEEVMEE